MLNELMWKDKKLRRNQQRKRKQLQRFKRIHVYLYINLNVLIWANKTQTRKKFSVSVFFSKKSNHQVKRINRKDEQRDVLTGN